MKQSWQLMKKTMNTWNYHTHRRIKTCIWKYRNGNRYVPGWWATMRLSKSEVSAQLKNNFKHVVGQNRNNHAWQLNQPNNQSIMRKTHMLGPHQSPFIFAWINITGSIILELWKIHLCLLKPKGAVDCFENQSRIKTIWEKIGFLKFIWKLDVNYLKIGVLEIKYKNENFRN